jgi:threonine dehydrogenase-like Zn-dependent dehydrogenase
LGVQRGLKVHVLDQMSDGVKPELVRALGATYHTGGVRDACAQPDVIIECTGVSSVVLDAMSNVGNGGVVCLTGVSSGGHTISVDEGSLNRNMVLENVAVVGSVNANRRHYELAAAALALADRPWLDGVVNRRVPLVQWREALDRQVDDVKVVIQISS